jgi:hypothetical protein
MQQPSLRSWSTRRFRFERRPDRGDDGIGQFLDPRLRIDFDPCDLALCVVLHRGDLAAVPFLVVLNCLTASDRDPIGQLRLDELNSSLAVVTETVCLRATCDNHPFGLGFELLQPRADGRNLLFSQLVSALLFPLGRGTGCTCGPEPFEQFTQSEHEAAILLPL